VLGGVLYLALLTLVGELGRQDIGVLKTALLTKVYPAKPLRAADPA
jgi:hypothetical protein